MTLRKQIITTIQTELEPLDFVNALWEGGSAAFDRVDQYSDIDLQIDVADACVEHTFEAVEAALLKISPIKDKFRIPEPTWHGHSQCFYKLRDARDYLQIDCAIIKTSSTDKFVQRELHGEPSVLFDKIGVIEQAAPFDWDAHNELLRERITFLCERFERMQVYVEKEILRRHSIDVMGIFRPMTLDPIIEMLRIKHDPARYNWGLRYLHHHLSLSDQARLTDLLYVQDLHELAEKYKIAQKWFWRLADELKETYKEIQ